MKSQAKVKQQRRIKNIPNYGEMPIGRDERIFRNMVEKGIIKIPPSRKQRRTYVKK